MKQNSALKTVGSNAIRFAGLLLLFTASAKGKFLFSGAALLQAVEPVTGLSYGTLFIVAATLEAIIGVSALVYPRRKSPAIALLWLALGLAAYRTVRYFAGVRSPCKCLGDLLNWWPWGLRHEAAISWVVILVLITATAGGYLLCHSMFVIRQSKLTGTVPTGAV